jgi:hypothetical protein
MTAKNCRSPCTTTEFIHTLDAKSLVNEKRIAKKP